MRPCSTLGQTSQLQAAPRCVYWRIMPGSVFDRTVIDFPCPSCGFYNDATLREVRLQDAIICRGCKITIMLVDPVNETRVALRRIDRAIRKLEEQVSSIGVIEIRF